MIFTPASHQQQAMADIKKHLMDSQRKGICVISGAGGKSIVIAKIAEHQSSFPGYRTLIVTHRKELLLQNIGKIQHASVGLVSSSLKRWEYDKEIVVAGINTIYNKAEHLGKIHLILIDECQRVSNNPEDKSMYWQLMRAYPFAKVIGFTALPHRLSDGSLTWGDVCHFTSYENLLHEGLVTPLSNKVCYEPDLSKVAILAKDYVMSDYADKCLKDPRIITQTAQKCFQVFKQNKLKKMIGFAPTVKYAQLIGIALHEAGFKIWGADGLTGILTGESTPEERKEILRRHKACEFNALINVEILTEGYDDPELDLLANWRPTQSLSLHHQMLYRAARLSNQAIWNMQTKEERLAAISGGTKPFGYVVDFSGNLKRHGGLVDTSWQYLDGQLTQSTRKSKFKVCANCEELVPVKEEVCPICKYRFLKESREVEIDGHYDNETDINAKRNPVKTYTVSDVEYFPDWVSSKKHKMLKIYYKCGNYKLPEYVFNNMRAAWLKKRGWSGAGAVDWATLKKPRKITVNTASKYPKILKYEW
jgi:DNA repair protein RadD